MNITGALEPRAGGVLVVDDQHQCGLAALPDDTKLNILGHMEFDSLCLFIMTSSHFGATAADDRLWAKLSAARGWSSHLSATSFDTVNVSKQNDPPQSLELGDQMTNWHSVKRLYRTLHSWRYPKYLHIFYPWMFCLPSVLSPRPLYLAVLFTFVILASCAIVNDQYNDSVAE